MSKPTRGVTFWNVVQPLLDDGKIERGTIMGHSCVRAGGEFLAMPNAKTDGMVIKLTKDRVTEIVRSGEGDSFAPAGRVFKEWVLIPEGNEHLWSGLIQEGMARHKKEP